MRLPHEGHLQDPLDGFSPKPHPSPADKSSKDPRNSRTLSAAHARIHHQRSKLFRPQAHLIIEAILYSHVKEHELV